MQRNGNGIKHHAKSVAAVAVATASGVAAHNVNINITRS